MFTNISNSMKNKNANNGRLLWLVLFVGAILVVGIVWFGMNRTIAPPGLLILDFMWRALFFWR